MARYYRYRKYSRRFRSSGKWSTRLQTFSGSQSTTLGNDFITYVNLCQNPVQNETTVSNKYTVKNIDCYFTLTSTPAYIKNCQAYIMFIPQGMVPSGVPSDYANLPFQHPEYILAHRFLGQPMMMNTQQPCQQAYRMKSRLARKLDTGDRIVLILMATHDGNNVDVGYSGSVKFNTKAN